MLCNLLALAYHIQRLLLPLPLSLHARPPVFLGDSSPPLPPESFVDGPTWFSEHIRHRNPRDGSRDRLLQMQQGDF